MRTHKVTFIKTPVHELMDDRLEPDLGLLYVATYLKQNLDVKVQILDLSVTLLEDHLKECLGSDVFCFSTFTANYFRTLDLKKQIQKSRPDAFFIAGGHHATALPDEVANDYDYVIVGEGETALLDLISALLGKINPQEKVIIGQPMMNLDDIPFPDYSLVDLNKYTRIVNGKKAVSIVTSRGCPYECVFCNSIVTKRVKSVRFRSAENVYKEVTNLHRDYGITAFRIQDDMFNINLNRLNQIADLLAPHQFEFRCFARIDMVSADVLTTLKKMGVKHISFGFESGSQKILDKMNKSLFIDDMKNNFHLVQKYGFGTRVYLIVGFPGENYDTLRETEQMIKECKPNEIVLYPLIPYPGTPLYHQPQRFGITYIDHDYSKYFQIYGHKEAGYVFETDDMSREDLKTMRNFLSSRLQNTAIWAIDSKMNV